jgi:hypothetical protein
MTKPKLYRLCFDFESYEGVLEFWESFVSANLVPNGDDWRTCGLVHKDALHDEKYSVQTLLVRSQVDGAGNGRPVTHTTISEKKVMDKPGQGLSNK